MSKNIDISIIIVNYNVKDFLYQCINSIYKSPNNLNIEIIVVDNNSKDGSADFIKSKFANLKFIELNENLGFARANNIGIKESKGKYILILNPDTIIQEDTLRKMYDFMESHPEIGCSGCKVLNPDGSFQLACRRGFPTPWASFSKLFGLQKLFPKSKFFAKYNQTFRSTDETYEIDAIMGAFMFCRKIAIDQVNGFDNNFFMYGEDIDLCWRLRECGWKVYYYHQTSIIHYKGESTRRSSINEIKHFYKAMEIFAKKHYSKSKIFLSILKLGIFIRTALAYLNKYKRDLLIIFTDLAAINFSLIFTTWLRFGDPFSFPDYAYPTVFIVISIVILSVMIMVGEYFEGKYTARKAIFGLLISFFILSSFTYYFKDYAFSRGVLLATIGLTGIIAVMARGIISLVDKTTGYQSDVRIAFIGINEKTENIIKSLKNSNLHNIDIVGLISLKPINNSEINNFPILSNIDYLWEIISKYSINEVIITENDLTKFDLMRILKNNPGLNVRFHIAEELEELISARIINEITGKEPTIPEYNLSKFRFKVIKRLFDLNCAIFLLTLGLPLILLFDKPFKEKIKMIINVLKGKYSIVGILPVEKDGNKPGKEGLIGLAHISKPETLSKEAIIKLNEYYRINYNLSLDLDIIIKFIFRKKSGK